MFMLHYVIIKWIISTFLRFVSGHKSSLFGKNFLSVDYNLFYFTAGSIGCLSSTVS